MSAVQRLLLIAAGGALGALLRFWLSNAVHRFLDRGFPYGTLAVNVLGSGLMGVAYVLLIERLELGPEARAFLLIGLLGAFTTFSTFSLETLNLIEAGDELGAALNMLLSVSLCVVACWAGMVLGRQL